MESKTLASGSPAKSQSSTEIPEMQDSQGDMHIPLIGQTSETEAEQEIGGFAARIVRRAWHVLTLVAIPILHYAVRQYVFHGNDTWLQRIWRYTFEPVSYEI